MRTTMHTTWTILIGLAWLGACDPPEDEFAAEIDDDAGEIEPRALLTMKSVMTYAKNAGVPCSRLVVTGALAKAESELKTDAKHWNEPDPPYCPNGSLDRGLWQINDCWWPNYSDACTYDAVCNAKAMAQISNYGADFSL